MGKKWEATKWELKTVRRIPNSLVIINHHPLQLKKKKVWQVLTDRIKIESLFHFLSLKFQNQTFDWIHWLIHILGIFSKAREGTAAQKDILSLGYHKTLSCISIFMISIQSSIEDNIYFINEIPSLDFYIKHLSPTCWSIFTLALPIMPFNYLLIMAPVGYVEQCSRSASQTPTFMLIPPSMLSHSSSHRSLSR